LLDETATREARRCFAYWAIDTRTILLSLVVIICMLLLLKAQHFPNKGGTLCTLKTCPGWDDHSRSNFISSLVDDTKKNE
jgi:hypothetical protein